MFPRPPPLGRKSGFIAFHVLRLSFRSLDRSFERRAPDPSALPTLLGAGNAVRETRENRIDYGMADCPTKPAELAEILGAVKNWARQKTEMLVVGNLPEPNFLPLAGQSGGEEWSIDFSSSLDEAEKQLRLRRINLVVLHLDSIGDWDTAARQLQESSPSAEIIALAPPEANDAARRIFAYVLPASPTSSEFRAALRQLGFFAAEPERSAIRIDADIADLVPGFLQHRREDCEKIRGFLEQMDFAKIHILGHNLKGSGTGYGFQEITDRGRVIEEAAIRGDSPAVLQEVAKLELFLRDVRYEIEG